MSWELSQLVHRYAAAVDDRQSVVPLFTTDGVLVTPDPPDVLDPVHEHVGPEAIAQATSGLPRTFHAIVGEVYDGSRGRIACVAHHVLDEKTDLVWHLRYLDDYRQVDGRWLIARRALHLDLIETRPLKRSRVT
jgi:hypothetical protein